jgi:2,4-dienoyl-CoA reductase-like NADH-dependent reductase (Old Yellow Enzyme family)
MFRFSQWKQQDFDAVVAKTPAELESWMGVLVDAGVDILDASTRRFDQPCFEGSDMTLAGWTGKVSGKPVMAVGSIGLAKDMYNRPTEAAAIDPSTLDRVMYFMERGEFDLIGVGRSLIADPTWAVKARTGEPFIPYSANALAKLY